MDAAEKVCGMFWETKKGNFCLKCPIVSECRNYCAYIGCEKDTPCYIEAKQRYQKAARNWLKQKGIN